MTAQQVNFDRFKLLCVIFNSQFFLCSTVQLSISLTHSQAFFFFLGHHCEGKHRFLSYLFQSRPVTEVTERFPSDDSQSLKLQMGHLIEPEKSIRRGSVSWISALILVSVSELFWRVWRKYKVLDVHPDECFKFTLKPTKKKLTAAKTLPANVQNK